MATLKQEQRYRPAAEEGACEHCEALVYGDSHHCPQCGKFPIKLRLCPKCKSISSKDETMCWKCRRAFQPDEDFL